MTDNDRDTLSLQDEDRLPWLEAVDDDVDGETISTGKLIGYAVAALIALVVVVAGITFGGMKVEGQGDSSFAASEGAEANGKIDTNAAAEAPVTGKKAIPAKASVKSAPAKPVATAAVPASGGKLAASPPAKPLPNVAMAGASGSLVQLGSFGSEAKANEAWTTLAKRFAYLSTLPKSVVTAEVNGKQVYRLRANAGGEASTICGKLKVAGENCLIVN